MGSADDGVYEFVSLKSGPLRAFLVKQVT